MEPKTAALFRSFRVRVGCVFAFVVVQSELQVVELKPLGFKHPDQRTAQFAPIVRVFSADKQARDEAKEREHGSYSHLLLNCG